MQENCENCKYWKKDFGIFCVNGWSGLDRDDGYCYFEVKKISKKGADFCSHYLKE